jgi:hypothetical protein
MWRRHLQVREIEHPAERWRRAQEPGFGLPLRPTPSRR